MLKDNLMFSESVNKNHTGDMHLLRKLNIVIKIV